MASGRNVGGEVNHLGGEVKSSRAKAGGGPRTLR